MSRLHARIKDLEKDKARLIMELDRRDYRSEILKGNGEHSDMEIYDALRVNNQYCCFLSRHSCTGLALMLTKSNFADCIAILALMSMMLL